MAGAIQKATPEAAKARLSRQDSRGAGEVIPDSEEERRNLKEVIEISSDEEEALNEGHDPLLSIPGSWPASITSTLAVIKKPIIPARDVVSNVTPRKFYRAPRRVIESSDSESSDIEAKGNTTQSSEVIELSDSSPERSTPKESTQNRPNKAADSEDELFDPDEEDSISGNEDGAILTLNEPRSARKPLRLSSSLVDVPSPSLHCQLVLTGNKSLGLGALSNTTQGTPGYRRATGAPVTPSTLSRGATIQKSVRSPRVSKKAQAATEQAQRALYAQKLFEELNHSVFDDKLPKDTQLNWNKRLLTTAGRAKWHRSRDGVQATEIELAEKILDCNERIRNTLSHEMCHLASWIIDTSPKEVHGRIFKKWSDRVMRKRPEIEITTRHNYEIGFKFNWKCLKCAKIYGRHSKSIDVTRVVCGACREGKLTPLFETRVPRTPKTSKLAAAKPQDSPQLLPEASAEARTASRSTDRAVYTVHDSDSESDADVETLTTAMGLVTFNG